MKDMSEMSPEARSLIGEARALDGPTDEDRARVKRHVLAAIAGGAGVATSAVAGSAAASSAAAAGTVAAGTTATSLGVKVVIALIVATAALTTTYAVTHEPEPEPAAEAPIPASPEPELIVDVPAPARSEARPEVEEVAAEEAVEPEPSPTARPRRAPRAVRPPTQPVQPAQPAQVPVAPPTALSEEVALLRRAQRSMNSGDPGAALRSLEEHARRFPSGHMEEEREAARVVALCRAGRETEARAIASRFLAERPASPLAARVRAACP